MILDGPHPSSRAILGPLDYYFSFRFRPGDIAYPSHCPYREEYCWLFIVERRIRHLVENELEKFHGQLFGPHGIVNEALANAFAHGNKKEGMVPIEVRIEWREKGVEIQVRDQGEGFDITPVLDRLRQGQDYYHYAGNGLRIMAESERFLVAFSHHGTTFHLLCPLGDSISMTLDGSVVASAAEGNTFSPTDSSAQVSQMQPRTNSKQ